MRLVDMVSGPLKNITSAASATTKKIGETTGAVAKLKDKGSVVDQLRGHFQKLKGGVTDATDEIPGLNRVISLVTNPYVAVAAGIMAVGAAAISVTGQAMTFDRGMHQVNTTARLSEEGLGKLTGKLMDMGAKSTANFDQIPLAFNQVISAVGDTDKALAIFEPSLKAAQAGFTDIGVVTEAVTNVMGSVGKATPTQVFDTLFATMRVGKAEFKDIAAYLPRIIPLANNVGIKYQEIAAAFALMTTKGQTAEQTSMLLQNAMTALGKSEVIYGTKSQAGFIRSGVAIYDHAGKMRGLVDIVGDLSKRTQGMNDKQKQAFLAGLGLDAQAAASFSVLAQNAQGLRDFTKETTNSAGEMNKAYELSLNPMDRLTILQNQFKKVTTEIGYKLLPLVNWGIEKISGMLEWVNEHSHGIGVTFKVIAGIVGVYLLPEIMGVVYGVTLLYLAFRVVKAAVIAVATLFVTAWRGVGMAIDWVYQKLGGQGSLVEKLFGGTSAVWDGIKTLLSNFLKLASAGLDAMDLAAAGKFRDAAELMKQTWREVNGLQTTTKSTASFDDFFGLGKGDDGKGGKPGGVSPSGDLKSQNKGTDIQGDKSKARIVNTRIDKIEVIVKVASAAGRSMQDIGNQVASIIVGSVRDSEIILSNGTSD